MQIFIRNVDEEMHTRMHNSLINKLFAHILKEQEKGVVEYVAQYISVSQVERYVQFSFVSEINNHITLEFLCQKYIVFATGSIRYGYVVHKRPHHTKTSVNSIVDGMTMSLAAQSFTILQTDIRNRPYFLTCSYPCGEDLPDCTHCWGTSIW